MGCDIHSFAEVRQSDGSWRVVGDVFPLDDFSRRYHKKTHGHEPFSNRNYNLFGFLADVRTRAVAPICEAKGLPTDLSPEVRASAERWDCDGYSHSWLTVAELNAQPYEQIEKGEWGLGDEFYQHLAILRTLGSPEDVRVVFWFDN